MSAARRLRRHEERVPRGHVRCEKHGVERLVRVCEHAHEGFGAVRLGGGERKDRYILCPRCAKEDTFDREVCQKCIEEELDIAIDEEAGS